MDEFFRLIKNKKILDKEPLYLLSFYIWFFIKISDIITHPSLLSLRKEEKRKYLESIGNVIVKEFIFQDGLSALANDSSARDIAEMIDSLKNVSNDIVSVCDQAGQGAQADAGLKIREKLDQIKGKYLRWLLEK